MKEILLSREHVDDMLAHAREGSPNEVCGLMGGSGNTVRKLYRLRNMDASPVSYSFDPAEQLRVMKEMERDGLEMVGIYHSHPGAPAMPSQTDISRAFFPGTREPNFPGVIYVIVGLMLEEPEVKAYLITEESVEKVKVGVTQQDV